MQGQSRNKQDSYLYDNASSDYKKRYMIQEKKLLLQKHSREGAGKSQSYNYNEKPAPAVPSLISKSGYQDILT